MMGNERYIRQMILPGFGQKGQDALLAAKVLVVGAGGLGCPVLQYLAGAGVGTIGIADGDQVSLSNLHRQTLFAESDIGKNKAVSAAEKIKALNGSVTVKVHPFLLSKENALELIGAYDLVIDATDNFSAKYLINDVCVLLGKPFIYGAVSRYEGQLSVFNLKREGESSIHYRDLFPTAPAPGEIHSCEQTGVIGVLPGMIGALQAAEAIKIITGTGNPMYGRLFTWDVLQSTGFEILLQSHPDTPVINHSFFNSMDYSFDCEDPEDIEEINVTEFLQLSRNPGVFVLDVRERHEYPSISFSDAQIPMSELSASLHTLPEKEICVICHQGIRSIYAAQQIKTKRNLKVYSLKGGLTAYFNQTGL